MQDVRNMRLFLLIILVIDGGWDPASPLATRCTVDSKKMVVFNGKEDIFIQWLYGEFLVEGYNNIEDGFANLVNYDEDQGMQAGHGLPLQSPAWMQDQIFNFLR